jgi:ribosome-binding protein aMBF1 (putative translation factor)
VAKAKTKTKAEKPAKPKKERAVKEYQIKNATPALTAAVKQVAGTIRGLMEKKGMKPDVLADKLGVSESRARQLLDGRTISLRTLVEVFGIFGKTVKVVAD